MKTVLLSIIAIFSTSLLFMNAQTLTGPVDEERLLVRQDATRINEQNSFTSQPRSNEVIITQVGNSNSSTLNLASEDATALIEQRGDNNFSGITSFANQTNQRILQNGNDNTILSFGIFQTENQVLNFTQNGDSNTLIKYGENSISDKLKINIQGNDKTLIVRSFN